MAACASCGIANPNGENAFRRALVSDVAYGQLACGARATWHAAFASWLAGDRPPWVELRAAPALERCDCLLATASAAPTAPAG